MYIKSSSTISHQPTFKNPGFSDGITPLCKDDLVKDPDYREYISANSRRRLSPVLKMALACSKECVTAQDISDIDAIIVGTGLGSNHQTTRFLDKVFGANGGLISPTAFTLSTANSIAGQISIQLKNHGYNNTHTQSTLSFEQALIDGSLCLHEGMDLALVGAADEFVLSLFNLFKYLNVREGINTIGASFYLLSKEKPSQNPIRIIDVASIGRIPTENIEKEISAFLDKNNVIKVDVVLYSSTNAETQPILNRKFPNADITDFVQYSGVYLTNSAFALNYAVDLLSHSKSNHGERPVQTILICNNLFHENLGLILVTNHE
jgi:3-oxoacyl-[acyl-carrier-protein] synthase II